LDIKKELSELDKFLSNLEGMPGADKYINLQESQSRILRTLTRAVMVLDQKVDDMACDCRNQKPCEEIGAHAYEPAPTLAPFPSELEGSPKNPADAFMEGAGEAINRKIGHKE